jgi:hypothetical protein
MAFLNLERIVSAVYKNLRWVALGLEWSPWPEKIFDRFLRSISLMLSFGCDASSVNG